MEIDVLVSAYMWTAGLLCFGWFCINTIVASLFFPTQLYDPWLKGILRRLFRYMFVPVKVEGAKKIQPGRGYLYMCNHVSLFDMPLLGGFVPGVIRSVEADRQFRWPLYGLAVRRLGNIPIQRENIFSSMRSLRKARRKLAQKQSLVIMPEAHRTLDGKLRPFKRLPFLLAKQAGVDLVPVGLSGLFELKSKNSWKIRPVPLKVRFGEIIPAGTVARLPINELRDLTHERIRALVEQS
jgi:1-acyl-sn-glycerol-3-phosphate acyltransferase